MMKLESATVESIEACAAAIAELGGLDRELAKRQSDLDAEVAKLKAKAEASAEPVKQIRAKLEAAIEAFCVTKRAELTDGGTRKFGEFTSGKVGWRQGQPKLEVDPERLNAIIAALEVKRLKRLLRYKVELDARAILKEPDKIKGLKGIRILPAAERFWIEPVELPLAPAAAEAE
jgi:phage host-nuclease inhibitor protein Gam